MAGKCSLEKLPPVISSSLSQSTLHKRWGRLVRRTSAWDLTILPHTVQGQSLNGKAKAVLQPSLMQMPKNHGCAATRKGYLPLHHYNQGSSNLNHVFVCLFIHCFRSSRLHRAISEPFPPPVWPKIKSTQMVTLKAFR